MPRVKRDCTYPSCHAVQLVRLANHLEQRHNLRGESKSYYLQLAKMNDNPPQPLQMAAKTDALSHNAAIRSPPAKIAGQEKSVKAAIPLQPFSSIYIVGATGVGKSWFTKKLIEQREQMYERDAPKKVLYCYGVYQPLFAEMERKLDNILFHEGLPSEKYIDDYAASEHCLIIIDDLMETALQSPLVEKIFVQGCHHKRQSVVFISQNLYKQGTHARTIALNATYLCLFRNFRDQMQIRTLAAQLGQKNFFLESYQDAVTSGKYGYFFCDFSPHTENDTRFRTKIFPGEDTVIYVPKN